MLRTLTWMLVWMLGSACASAAYPERPVRFLIPFPPSGGADLVGRAVGQKLSERWGQQVIVDNRPGAGGNIAAEITAASAPDGYTLFQFNVANAIAPSIYRKLNYDPAKDFTGVTQLASSPFVLLVHPSTKVTTVQELITLARAEPGKLSYASSGIGGPSHLLSELFKAMSKTELVHVPYKGVALALNDFLSARVQVMFMVPATALPHMSARRLQALGISSAKRSPLVPDLPTIAESGLTGYEGLTWYGVVVPTRTPQGIVVQLNRDLRDVLQQPDVRDRLTAQGVEIVHNAPEAFTQFIRSEMLKWRQVATTAGARVD